MTRIFRNRIAVLGIVFLFWGCSKTEEIKVSDILIQNIGNEGLTIPLNETFLVEASTAPGNADRAGITYKSSDEEIFTVSAKGLIQPKQMGEAVLQVKTQDGSRLNDERTIIIERPSIETIEIEGMVDGYLIVGYNLEQKVMINLLPENSTPLVTFHTDDASVFTVTEAGRAEGHLLNGEANLTVRAVHNPDIMITCKVKVLDLTVEDIVVPADKIMINAMGGTYNLRRDLTILPAIASGVELQYESSRPDIATVDEEGIVTAKGRGDVQITVSSKDADPVKKTVNFFIEAELSYEGWTATASSYSESQGTPGAILVDGANPFWHSKWAGGEEPLPHWILVDMKEEHMITEIMINRRNFNNDLRKAIIEVSRDGSSFTQVGILDWGSSPSSDALRYASFAKQKARYIKITVTESNRGRVASINRMRVYGASE
ncbi:hypothetical protein FAZ19_11505 [Sphingobacterium alkalisoli]|uniref:F5/8 type C domain-containing protein n=1 Tax=Sphingobacterium alkalisoli TaxID=1874115 RepID=A0A4U0H5Y7_9SPHI|nr:discoidin domain-containing protein [Sphingobacterium alkalisoli]TJY65742.1 hypothetical protein FAZ19_11505 [Sphingobacterium alkalisoli]GGH18629.1 hypothetical protein GCM10011418_22380 [Sphingobacterium alkalisoli]